VLAGLDISKPMLNAAYQTLRGEPRATVLRASSRRRLYLTGCSMGGAGCWRIATAHPQRFAALLVICGRGKPPEMAPSLKSLPIWVFHGTNDRIVPVQASRAMVQAIRAAGSTSDPEELVSLLVRTLWASGRGRGHRQGEGGRSRSHQGRRPAAHRLLGLPPARPLVHHRARHPRRPRRRGRQRQIGPLRNRLSASWVSDVGG